MPDHDDNTGLLNLALRQYGSARRWRLTAILLLALDVAAVTAWVLIAAVRP